MGKRKKKVHLRQPPSSSDHPTELNNTKIPSSSDSSSHLLPFFSECRHALGYLLIGELSRAKDVLNTCDLQNGEGSSLLNFTSAIFGATALADAAAASADVRRRDLHEAALSAYKASVAEPSNVDFSMLYSTLAFQEAMTEWIHCLSITNPTVVDGGREDEEEEEEEKEKVENMAQCIRRSILRVQYNLLDFLYEARSREKFTPRSTENPGVLFYQELLRAFLVTAQAQERKAQVFFSSDDSSPSSSSPSLRAQDPREAISYLKHLVASHNLPLEWEFRDEELVLLAPDFGLAGVLSQAMMRGNFRIWECFKCGEEFIDVTSHFDHVVREHGETNNYKRTIFKERYLGPELPEWKDLMPHQDLGFVTRHPNSIRFNLKRFSNSLGDHEEASDLSLSVRASILLLWLYRDLKIAMNPEQWKKHRERQRIWAGYIFKLLTHEIRSFVSRYWMYKFSLGDIEWRLLHASQDEGLETMIPYPAFLLKIISNIARLRNELDAASSVDYFRVLLPLVQASHRMHIEREARIWRSAEDAGFHPS